MQQDNCQASSLIFVVSGPLGLVDVRREMNSLAKPCGGDITLRAIRNPGREDRNYVS